MMIIKLDLPASKAGKKSFLYIGIVIAAAILVCVGSFYFFFQIPEIKEEEGAISRKLEKEKIIEQQLQELDQLKEETQSLTEEEIQEQLKELEQIKQKIQSLTEEEIQKQLEELNKLH